MDFFNSLVWFSTVLPIIQKYNSFLIILPRIGFFIRYQRLRPPPMPFNIVYKNERRSGGLLTTGDFSWEGGGILHENNYKPIS